MSPEQCREAREKLNWSRQQLADTAGVPVIIINDYEDEGVVTIADCLEFVREAFEAAGVDFPLELPGSFSPRMTGEDSPSSDDLLRELEALQKRSQP